MPLGKREDLSDARFAGLELAFNADIEDSVASAESCGFDFVVAPLVEPARRPSVSLRRNSDGSLPPPFSLGQVIHTMYTSQISNQIVGHVSRWIDPDASDQELAAQSIIALEQELSWAAHMTVQACVLPTLPQRAMSFNYFRIINDMIVHGTAPSSLWVRIPVVSEELSSRTCDSNESSSSEKNFVGTAADDPWEWWNALRQACSHARSLGVALEVGTLLPSESELLRWRGEPVKAIFLRRGSFLRNRKGFPVLPRRHQELLADAFKRGIQVVLSSDHDEKAEADDQHVLHFMASMKKRLPAVLRYEAVRFGISQVPTAPPPPPSTIPTVTEVPLRDSEDEVDTQVATLPDSSYAEEFPPLIDLGMKAMDRVHDMEAEKKHPFRFHWEYLSFLFRRQPSLTPTELLEAPYLDYLQSPLQPLQDNLESQTYETFERDAIKYDVYQEAIRTALLEWTDHEGNEAKPIVIMVVGAGRGPLVTAALSAAKQAERDVRVYAVEKNPNAVIHMQCRARVENWNHLSPVHIVHGDMRCWQAPEQADILVSELLGSFGDNELSPECLDGAQRFLKPNGISIPCSYTSYIQPITTHKIWTELASREKLDQFETPFVVKLHRFAPLSSPQAVFRFSHPEPMTGQDTMEMDERMRNERSGRLTFSNSIAGGALCHGFAGYFVARLYKGVELSIHPETHTPTMSSWFPIMFPLRQPIYIPKNGLIEVSMWRRCNAVRVWYEWMAIVPETGTTTDIHNPDGRSYHVGL